MLGEEIVPNYKSRAREYTNYAIRAIRNVCKECGPRPVGSDSEKKAQEMMQKDLETCCDSVVREEYQCSDKAFMAWVPIGAVMLILGIVAFTLGFPVVTVALTVLCLTMIVLEFIIYKPFIDVFFPKKTSGNVIGVRKASGETKRRIIFSGHTDSAFEWTFTYLGGRPYVLTVIVGAVVAALLEIIGGIVFIVKGGVIADYNVWNGEAGIVLKVFAVVMYVVTPILIGGIFFSNFNRPVMGANDDLTGTFISCAVPKFMEANGIRFENTEVMVVCAGGEEAGLRGSKAFAKAHKELLNDGVETVFVGFDTICEPEFAKIYDKDMTGVVNNSREVAELIQRAAKSACDIDVPIGAIELGSTDAAAMSQGGFKASSMVMMDPAPARYYHTRLDTVEKLNPKAVEMGLLTALEAMFMFDKNGLSK